eukprot:CAMPEP_0202788624 /NCGR_PEP_ID=MMETSP1388-20130828/75243_1 /ASSEMBLY_ACC=CAM_ASM_000864 /TAXON_ID=37098 /ORGANISM="Isochrysis sp, Strain CCMP1244" /LENGTH=285 /DNA_ID=CAMNT_0049458279 /DNA_START=21 /DNA_END=878 /DNA_ORIENTATION=-
MGSASSVAPAPPVPEEPTASGCSLIGDCLSVRSRGDRWVRARVAATVDTETRGRLLAVHLEGGKRGALMWLHRELDAARIRPLAGADTPPPPVARGGDTESTFGRAVALVRWRLLKGARWAATRYDATAVFKDSRRLRIDLPSEDWLGSQLERHPFIGSGECALFPHACISMWEAAAAPSLYDDTTTPPFGISASGLMLSRAGHQCLLVENPSVHPPGPLSPPLSPEKRRSPRPLLASTEEEASVDLDALTPDASLSRESNDHVEADEGNSQRVAVLDTATWGLA